MGETLNVCRTRSQGKILNVTVVKTHCDDTRDLMRLPRVPLMLRASRDVRSEAVDPSQAECFKSPAWIEIVRNSCRAPREALAGLLGCIDSFSDDELCWVGVVVVEAIIDCGWAEIHAEFEAALRESTSLRKAASCAGPQDDEVYALLQRSLRPGEDVGRRKVSRDDQDSVWRHIVPRLRERSGGWRVRAAGPRRLARPTARRHAGSGATARRPDRATRRRAPSGRRRCGRR